MSRRHVRPAGRGATAVETPGSAVPTSLAMPPLPLGPADQLALQLLAEVRTARALGLVVEAGALCGAALRLGPVSAAVVRQLAEELFGLGLVPLATEALQRLVEADSMAPAAAYAFLIRCLLADGRSAEAAEVSRRGIAAHGQTGELLAGLGAALRREGRVSDGAAILRQAIGREADLAVAHGELALALMPLDRPDEAVAEHSRALSLCGVPPAGRHVGAYRTASVESWCRANGAPYAVAIAATAGCAFRPRYGDTPGLCESAELPAPDVYLAEIARASVIGGQSLILTADGRALSDPLFRHNAGRLDLAEPAVPYLDSRAALVDVGSIAPEAVPVGIALHGFGTRNYYHWLIEYLPRLLVLERCGVPADVPLLVDRRTLEVPQLVDALRAVDRSGRPIMSLEADVEYRVERLIVPSPLAWLAPNLRDHVQLELGDNLISPQAVTFIRDRLGAPERGTIGHRRIYIARRASTAPARMTNEPEVQDIFRQLGFEAVHPDRLSFQEQRSFFAEASVVASESGAGLANLLLAPVSATLVCLQAEELPMNVYADLAGHIGQRALFVAGDIVGERPAKPYQARFTIAPDRLRQILEGLASTD